MSHQTSKRKNKKEFGVIGLGRMGGDLTLQAIEKGWRVVGYNRSPERTRTLAMKGLVAASSLAAEHKREHEQPKKQEEKK